ncbi:MAG: hypothetical protein JNJ90_04730 [Saprospiraceae bacterium]|nr:hypothetical protein [Saprospiraceae bacterium]
MTDAELHKKTAGLLAGTLPEADAEQFRATLRDSEPLREQARRVALGLLLGEHSEQLDLLQKMDGWENEMSAETPADTDTARLELLLNERQDEIELLQKMDVWENDLVEPTAPSAPFPVWRWVGTIVLAALLVAVLLTWICSPRPEPTAPENPATPSLSPTGQPRPSQPKPSEKDQPAPKPSGEKNTTAPAAKHQYIALAKEFYRQSAVTTGNIRSIPTAPPGARQPRHNPPGGGFHTGIEDATVSDGSAAESFDALRSEALTRFENRRWPEAVRALNALLGQLPESEKPVYLLLIGGAFFEQGDFQRAASVFSQKSLSDHPEYGYDAQRYELLSRLADLPAGGVAFRQLIRTIRQDPDNPNRELVAEILRKTPDL